MRNLSTIDDGGNSRVKRKVLHSVTCLAIIATLSLAATSSAFAEDAPNAQAAVAAAAEDNSEVGNLPIYSKVLDNGLTVIVMPSTVVPIVTIEIAVKNGAFTESPKESGLSHLFEHMFFKSNAVIPNQEAYMKRMRELGIVFNGTTGNERVNYFFTLPKMNLVPGLKFMYDAITSVKFDQAEFAKEKEVVVGEVDRNEANPYYWFNLSMQDALFYKYPNRKNALGTRKSVRAATTRIMDRMKKTYYVPNNSALLIAGDVEPEEAFALAETQFSSWKKGRDPFKRHKVPVHPELKEDKYLVVNQPVNVPVVQMTYHGPSVNIDPKATYAADVLTQYLSQSDSPFQKALVDSQLAYSASLSYFTQAHVGPINATVSAAPDKLFTAVGALVRELEKLKDPSYYTATGIQNAKTTIAVNEKYGQESPSSYIHTISFFWAVASLDYMKSYLPSIQEVTAEDIADFAKKYIDGKHFVAGLLANEAQTKEFGFTTEALKNAIENANNVAPAAEATTNTTTDAATDGSQSAPAEQTQEGGK